MNTFDFCVKIDLSKTMDVLHDYFATTVPPEYLAMNVISSSGQLLGEVIDDTISDTFARDILIARLVASLPDSEDKEWPTYGTSKEDSELFYKWYGNAIKHIGGKFED